MTNGDDGAFTLDSGAFGMRGLTKREYFAALALQAIVSKSPFKVGTIKTHDDAHHMAAVGAVWYADELIKQLNKQGALHGKTEINGSGEISGIPGA